MGRSRLLLRDRQLAVCSVVSILLQMTECGRIPYSSRRANTPLTIRHGVSILVLVFDLRLMRSREKYAVVEGGRVDKRVRDGKGGGRARTLGCRDER
jgi:hypothetical protein